MPERDKKQVKKIDPKANAIFKGDFGTSGGQTPQIPLAPPPAVNGPDPGAGALFRGDFGTAGNLQPPAPEIPLQQRLAGVTPFRLNPGQPIAGLGSALFTGRDVPSPPKTLVELASLPRKSSGQLAQTFGTPGQRPGPNPNAYTPQGPLLNLPRLVDRAVSAIKGGYNASESVDFLGEGFNVAGVPRYNSYSAAERGPNEELVPDGVVQRGATPAAPGSGVKGNKLASTDPNTVQIIRGNEVFLYDKNTKEEYLPGFSDRQQGVAAAAAKKAYLTAPERIGGANPATNQFIQSQQSFQKSQEPDVKIGTIDQGVDPISGQALPPLFYVAQTKNGKTNVTIKDTSNRTVDPKTLTDEQKVKTFGNPEFISKFKNREEALRALVRDGELDSAVAKKLIDEFVAKGLPFSGA